MSTINPLTGLPHLPPKYVWRIYESNCDYYRGVYSLGIFYKGFFGRLYGSIVSKSIGFVGDTLEELQRSAKDKAPRVITALEQKLADDAKEKKAATIVGSYPPKRIP